MTCRSHRLLFACLLPLGIPLSVHADDADVLTLRASASLLRDDNLFRVSNTSGQKAQTDTVTTTVVGADLKKQLSLQEIVAHVSWVDTRYQSNADLNAGALQYDGAWRWQVGSHLKGELSADRSAAQNSFADFRGLRQRNLRTTENQRFNLDYAFHPSWHVTGGVVRQTVSNDQLLAADSDLEASGVNLGLRYTPASGNWIGWQARQLDGKYVQRPFDPSPGVQFDSEFTESGQDVAFNWRPTGHSAFTGRLGYLERKHPNLADRNFSGWTGQLGYTYQYSDRTALSATYFHGLTAFQQVSSSYYVSDDLTLASQWAATEKLSLGARLGYSRRHYRGEILPLPAGQSQQQDNVGRFGVDLAYRPIRWLELRAGLATEKRNSNTAGFDYTDHQALLAANARF